MVRDEYGDEVFPDEDFTPVSAPPRQAEPHERNRIRDVIIAVVATIAVLAFGLFGWQKYTDRQAAEKTKEIAAQVEQSIQNHFNTDTNLSKYSVRVLRVDLNQVTDTKYEGVATVNTAQSAVEHLVPIDVTTYGDERFMWKAEPGALLFLIQE
ncbi:hypothetical protein [Mycolicibacterium porcinum]|uniref:Uncharacterized protein n=1 Tax=Mycolicibacterium porcinum TaxID=39693 RepID=A0ABV3VKF6_9MYCO